MHYIFLFICILLIIKKILFLHFNCIIYQIPNQVDVNDGTVYHFLQNKMFFYVAMYSNKPIFIYQNTYHRDGVNTHPCNRHSFPFLFLNIQTVCNTSANIHLLKKVNFYRTKLCSLTSTFS